MALPEQHIDFTRTELMVLVSIAYHQPVTRAGVSDIIGHEASRDIIAALRDKNMITAGPRSPTPGAPFTYVTTKGFLEHFGLERLRDLEALEDAGLLTGAATEKDEMTIVGAIAGEFEIRFHLSQFHVDGIARLKLHTQSGVPQV